MLKEKYKTLIHLTFFFLTLGLSQHKRNMYKRSTNWMPNIFRSNYLFLLKSPECGKCQSLTNSNIFLNCMCMYIFWSIIFCMTLISSAFTASRTVFPLKRLCWGHEEMAGWAEMQLKPLSPSAPPHSSVMC